MEERLTSTITNLAALCETMQNLNNKSFQGVRYRPRVELFNLNTQEPSIM